MFRDPLGWGVPTVRCFIFHLRIPDFFSRAIPLYASLPPFFSVFDPVVLESLFFHCNICLLEILSPSVSQSVLLLLRPFPPIRFSGQLLLVSRSVTPSLPSSVHIHPLTPSRYYLCHACSRLPLLLCAAISFFRSCPSPAPPVLGTLRLYPTSHSPIGATASTSYLFEELLLDRRLLSHLPPLLPAI